MAYNELIKNFEKVRAYMREFYVYGFKSRTEYDAKSARSYDDERRRLESWLGDYMRFTQTPEGKNVFLSVDSRVTRKNPFYKAWKAKSFTDGDITLHFAIFDILYDPETKMTLTELIEEIDQRLSSRMAFDESTLRKKLKEYAEEGMAKFEYMQRAFSSELKPRARLVLQVLVLHCNKEGECFPSIKTIAAKCGYGVSTVKRALDELVKAGYIVKQARFDERKNGGQTSNLYTLCSDLLCPDEPENAPVLEDDASDESPAVQPESAPADACNASDPTPGEQSATLPTADSYSFADGFETKIGRQFCRPIRMWTGGQSIFIPP